MAVVQPPVFSAADADRQYGQRSLFLCLIAVLVCAGIQMVQSASLSSRPSSQYSAFSQKHLICLAVSVFAGVAASGVSPDRLRRHSTQLLGVLILLLVLTLIPGIGSRVNGASRWLRAGGLSVQPSEFGRIILPLAAAVAVTETGTAGFALRRLIRILGPLFIVLALVAAEPDLGATVFLGFGCILTLFLGGWPIRHFLGCGVIILPLLGSVAVLRPYQVQRITGFLDAWQDLRQAPWQVRQSLMSLGSGGFDGQGVGGGWQKLSYLPEANTDFVFAVIGEELGLAGTMTICSLWIAVLVSGTASLRHLARGSFEWVFGITLLLQLVLQAMANIAVVTAVVPPKGVPHPFISYGGTNLLVSLISVGLISGMSRNGFRGEPHPSQCASTRVGNHLPLAG